MRHVDAARVVAANRGDALVVITMTTIFAWPEDDDAPKIRCAPLMGGASSIGLGLALARPDKRVVVCDGDGSLLMQLGALATIAGAAPTNLVHLVFDNGVLYEGGGRLPIANARRVDFAAMAIAAGYRSACVVRTAEELSTGVSDALAGDGPSLIQLQIELPDTPTWSASNPHSELPDWWFTMMRDDARAVAEHLRRADRV